MKKVEKDFICNADKKNPEDKWKGKLFFSCIVVHKITLTIEINSMFQY